MINKVTLLGRIGKKDFKPTRNGSHICSLSIATNKRYNDSSGTFKELTTWHNVNFFNKIAEVSNKYANVGDLVYIEGEISNKKVEENGVNRIIHSIIGSEIKVLFESKKKKDKEKIPDDFGNKIADVFNKDDLPW